MGKYDGMLLCSDFDGTLYWGGGIPENNLRAIAEFEREGGRFTLCTGRKWNILQELKLPLTLRTPMVCINGSMICTPEGAVLFEQSMDGRVLLPTVLALREEWKDELQGFHVYAPPGDSFGRIAADETERLTEAMSQMIYKIVLVCRRDGGKEADDARGIALRERCRQLFDLDAYSVVRSWDIGVEILNPQCTKGKTAKRLCRMIGAEKLICVGDFENDVDMLQEADLAFAVENARDAVKACAHQVLCHARDGAIADLISRL